MDDQYNNNDGFQGDNGAQGQGFDAPQPENPYGQQGNPYEQQNTQQSNPYGQQQQQSNPYGQGQGQEQQQSNPYGQQDAQQGAAYGQQYSYDQQNSYGSAYNSSNYSYQEMPDELRKWNWGAMMFNIFWGIGNKAYMPLLCLIPCFSFIWMFVCGAKGNEWAWNAGTYQNLETFKAAQDSWNRAGFVSFIIAVVCIALYIIAIIVTIALGASMFSGLEELVNSGGFDYYDFA